MNKNVIYLHGFASSPRGAKALIFDRRLAQRGIFMRRPDLNMPDFEHLTLTAMIRRAAGEIAVCPPGPVYLIGSSLGASVALHLVDRFRETEAARVEKLLFLAPSFDFIANRLRDIGQAGLDEWRETRWQKFYHHQYKAEREVSYKLVYDLQKYDSFSVKVDLPILLFHGMQDESVDYRQSIRFAQGRPNVTLRLVDSDHTLLNQIEPIWQAMIEFFDI